jgi:hypothetical protein
LAQHQAVRGVGYNLAGKVSFSRSVDRRVTRRVVGSSVYLTVPRNERFALTFRERYAREILRTSFEVHLVLPV